MSKLPPNYWTKFNGERRGVSIYQVPDVLYDGFYFKLHYDGLVFGVEISSPKKLTDEQVSGFLDSEVDKVLLSRLKKK